MGVTDECERHVWYSVEGVDRILAPRLYPWTPWEDDIIVQSVNVALASGASEPSWIAVAKELPGRTDTLVRERYLQLHGFGPDAYVPYTSEAPELYGCEFCCVP